MFVVRDAIGGGNDFSQVLQGGQIEIIVRDFLSDSPRYFIENLFRLIDVDVFDIGDLKIFLQGFVEVFLKDGKRMNGRFVIRLIEGRAASASQTGASPSEEGGAKTDAIWIAWLPKDQASAFK